MIAYMKPNRGKPDLSEAIKAECRALLRQGVPQIEIAARLRISRGSVHRLKYAGEKRDDPNAPVVALDPGEILLEEAIRCKGCGGKIEIVPCRLCRVNAT